MKKVLSSVLAAAAALLVSACAAPATTAPATAPTEAVAATSAPAAAAAPTSAPTAAPTADATSAPAAAAGAPVNSPLAGTEWRVTFLGSQDEPEKVVRELAATVAFGADGTLTGSTGCAAFSGTYAADEAALTVSDLAVAGGACESADAQAQAARVAELLGKADGFSTEGVVLEVTAGDDALWFQPAS